MALTSVSLGLRELLHDPARRQEFFRALVQDEVASQIRSLRKRRGLKQEDIATSTGMKQSAVSRIEQAEYSSWTLTTLLRVAASLDARWRMTLEPAEEAIKEYESIDATTDDSASVEFQTVENVAAVADAQHTAFRVTVPTIYPITASSLQTAGNVDVSYFAGMFGSMYQSLIGFTQKVPLSPQSVADLLEQKDEAIESLRTENTLLRERLEQAESSYENFGPSSDLNVPVLTNQRLRAEW